MMLLDIGGEEKLGVRFGNAGNAKLVNPISYGDGRIAEWSADAVNCGIDENASVFNDGSAWYASQRRQFDLG